VKARVTVRPRPEILDPQGKAIHEALGRIGLSRVSEVRAGKNFDLELDVKDREAAEELLEELCRKVLANPLIESYEYELEAG